MQELCSLANGTTCCWECSVRVHSEKGRGLLLPCPRTAIFAGCGPSLPPICIPLPKTPRYVRVLSYPLDVCHNLSTSVILLRFIVEGRLRVVLSSLIRSHIADLNPSGTSLFPTQEHLGYRGTIYLSHLVILCPSSVCYGKIYRCPHLTMPVMDSETWYVIQIR